MDINRGADEPIEFDACGGTCYLYTVWCLLTRGITIPCVCFPYKYITSQEVTFSDGKLVFSYDWWIFRQERTIPLDRIQDVDINENFLERCCAIAEISVKTASGGRKSAVSIIAPRNPIHVRNRIMAERDAFIHGHASPVPNCPVEGSTSPSNQGVNLEMSRASKAVAEDQPFLVSSSQGTTLPSAGTWNDTLCRLESRLQGILTNKET